MKRTLAPNHTPGHKHIPDRFVKKRCPACYAKDRGRHLAVQEINQFSLWCYRCGTQIIYRFDHMGQVGQRPTVNIDSVRIKTAAAQQQRRRKKSISPIGSIARRAYFKKKLQDISHNLLEGF